MVLFMSKRNRKQWTLTLNSDLEQKISNYKKEYSFTDNKDVLNHLLDNSLKLKNSTIDSINKVCTEYNITKQDLLNPIIEKYINKTLKRDRVIKDKNKHTSKSENELMIVLKDIIEHYTNLPIKDRKFISATLVNRYLIINNDKYKQKNMSVIKRILSGLSDNDISFIDAYHKENNLTVRSNLKH